MPSKESTYELQIDLKAEKGQEKDSMNRKTPTSVAALENLGRVRLSQSFYFRDFLYSEIANFYGIPNIPEDPELAIRFGTRLCEELLEPLQQTFGRIAIRSAYRSPTINGKGNEKGHNCGSNESNYAAHIWDKNDADGFGGAMACVVVPWFTERYERGEDWRALAYWIHNHLPYSTLTFFPRLCAFNIGWHERPTRSIFSYIAPKGRLLAGELPDPKYAHFYPEFPALRVSSAITRGIPKARMPMRPIGSRAGADGCEIDQNGRMTNGRIMLELLGDEPDVSHTSLALARELGLPKNVLDRLQGPGKGSSKSDADSE